MEAAPDAALSLAQAPKQLRLLGVPWRFNLYYGWMIVGTATVTSTVSSPMGPLIFAFFFTPMTEDLGWSRSVLTWAFTLRVAAGAVTAPLMGRLVDRFGARVPGVFTGLAGGACIMALAAVSSTWLFVLLFMANGLVAGSGGRQLTAVPVAKWFVAKRGRAMGIAQLGGPIGITVFLLPVQAVLDAFGWRMAWLLLGASYTVVVVLAMGLLMRRTPEEYGLAPDGATAGHAATVKEPLVAARDEASWQAGDALRTPALWLALSGIALMAVPIHGMNLYRVAYWQEHGVSSSLIALGTQTEPITLLVSILAFGLLGERMPPRHFGLISAAGLGLSALTLLVAPGSAYSVFAHCAIFGIGAGAYVTANNLVWPAYFGRKFLGGITGLITPVMVVAMALGPLLYVYMLDFGVGFKTVWLLSLVLAVAAGALLFLSRKPQPRGTGALEGAAEVAKG